MPGALRRLLAEILVIPTHLDRVARGQGLTVTELKPGLPVQREAGLLSSTAKLYHFMSPRRRRQFVLVLALMFLGAFAELATIGAVLPFLTILAGTGSNGPLPQVDGIANLFRTGSPADQMFTATAVFVIIAVCAGLIRLQLAWSSQSFVFKLGHELGVDMQRRILLQPYSFHIRSNTSTLIAALEKVQTLLFNVLLPLMQASTAIILSIFIVGALIYIDPITAIVAASSFSAIYLAISFLTRARLLRNSAIGNEALNERILIIQESLGGIRDVIIDGTQATFLEEFRRVDRRLNDSRSATSFIAASPRFIIEASGMVLIALLANLLAQRAGGIAAALPVLGALALGAQRLLPLVQQVYNGWTIATGNRGILAQILELLSLPESNEYSLGSDIEPLPFTDRIVIEQVSFAYSGRRARALEDLSLTIERGVTIGLIGRTGSGKSTLADLLMGLLEPTSGRITVDGVAIDRSTRQRWWRSVAHVPQAIFLSDQSIARNIAFGVPAAAIDQTRLVEAANKAQMNEFIASLPDGYETEVGERGVRLSGGQRQRLGLARAIYKQAPVLVLDEATSALDDATEAAVMDAVTALGRDGRTIIIVAHRMSTVARCDLVAKLDNGRLIALGSYAEVVGDAPGRATK